ncbi:Fluoroacetyl-CoA thioesterase [bioreactor metagenome]|uniref:Fluoroacetyl-CoA thioesterase n=1 Tax=bioreactor metagenome TaxID=1076179 RepID=A0A645H1L4_9ZZZZ
MIEAAVQAVDPYLPKSYISVGKALQITHLQPTTMGMMVTVKAELTQVDGGKLHFEITAYDELGEIGKGWHERIIVNRDRFMEKIRQRVTPLEEKLK